MMFKVVLFTLVAYFILAGLGSVLSIFSILAYAVLVIGSLVFLGLLFMKLFGKKG